MKRNTAVAVAAAVLAVGVVLGAVAITRAASAAPASAPLPVAYSGAAGWHQARARPPVIYLGESNVFVRTPRWPAWSGSSARASGKLFVNTCTPTCSAGHYRTYRAQVSFWRVAVHHGVRYFSRMRLRYWHGGQRDYVFRWAVLPGATIPGWNGGPSAQLDLRGPSAQLDLRGPQAQLDRASAPGVRRPVTELGWILTQKGCSTLVAQG